MLLAVTEIVQDFGIYPRNGVNAQHQLELTEAKRAGAVFPAVIVAKGTRKLIDGFHRLGAEIKVNGPAALIEVEEREYASEADMFLDAVRLNAAHGMRLSRHDYTKAILKARELNVGEVFIGEALSLLPEQMASLIERKTATGEGGAAVVLKQSASHLAGRQLTERQEKGVQQSTGLRATFIINQMLNLLQSDLIDQENPLVMLRLRELEDALGVFLGAVPVTV